MERALLVALVGTLILTSIPVAAARPDGAGSGPHVELVHDAARDRTLPAQIPVTFGWVLFDANGEPFPHHDAVFEVTLDNTTLLRTTPASGHDYDGVDRYTVVFPEPGRFTVTVRVLVRDPLLPHGPSIDGEEDVLASDTITGRVVSAHASDGNASLTVPETPAAWSAEPITYRLASPSGGVAEATQADLRVRRLDDGMETLHIRTHADDGTHRVRYAFPAPGTYAVEATLHGRGAGHPAIAPVHVAKEVTVTEAGPALPRPATRTFENTVDVGEADGEHALFATYDPYTAIGPDGRIRLGTVAWDGAANRTARDVRMSVTLTGPDGATLLATSSLRAPQGVQVVTIAPERTGDYALALDARGPGWDGSSRHRFSVQPPVHGTTAGPLLTGVAAPSSLEAGDPASLAFAVHDAADRAPIHTEVDFRLTRGDRGVAVAAGKLHAHRNGTFPTTVRFETGGRHRVDLRPTPTLAMPITAYHGDMLGEPPVFDLDIAPGPASGAVPSPAPSETADGEAGATVPLLAPGVLLVAAAVAAWVRRRS